MEYFIQIKKTEIWTLPENIEIQLQVVSGKAWVTVEGIPKDFIYKTGDTIPRLGPKTVISSLEDQLYLKLVIVYYESKNLWRVLRKQNPVLELK